MLVLYVLPTDNSLSYSGDGEFNGSLTELEPLDIFWFISSSLLQVANLGQKARAAAHVVRCNTNHNFLIRATAVLIPV